MMKFYSAAALAVPLAFSCFACVAVAQQLPGTSKEPDYVGVFRRIQQSRSPDQTRGAQAATSERIALDVPRTAVCSSPGFKQAIEESLDAQSTGLSSNNLRREQLKQRQIAFLLDNLAPDNSAEARAIAETYSQLSASQRLGELVVCTLGAAGMRISFHASVFIKDGQLSGGFEVTGIGWPPYVSETFGGLTRERYMQLESASCSRSDIRAAAAQAVADIIASNVGIVDVNGYKKEFNKLRADNGPIGKPLRERLRRQHPYLSEIEVCSVPASQDGWLATVVAREGPTVGGFVINFGVPNTPAYFGNPVLAHL